jgi:hypothetical protein
MSASRPTVFKRYRFATRVRTGDDNRTRARPGINIDGNNSLMIEEGMTGLDKRKTKVEVEGQERLHFFRAS